MNSGEHSSFEARAARLLSGRGWTVAVAESCTGGLLGQRLTARSGSSSYFLGGVIAYANDVKADILGVDRRLLETVGAVSREVAGAMAVKVRELLLADIGISVTGIAGPDGGTDQKPVGLVYLGLSDRMDVWVEEKKFSGDREEIRMQASEYAMRMLVKYLEKKGE